MIRFFIGKAISAFIVTPMRDFSGIFETKILISLVNQNNLGNRVSKYV